MNELKEKREFLRKVYELREEAYNNIEDDEAWEEISNILATAVFKINQIFYKE